MTKSIENTTNKKGVIFSHNDLDGSVPTLLVKAAYGNDLIYAKENSYQEIDKNLVAFIESDDYNKDDVVLYITNIGINADTVFLLEGLYLEGAEIHLIDHHDTNTHLNQYDWATVIPEENGKKECGTSLLYRHLVASGLLEATPFLDTFVDTVRAYDTWEWEAAGNMLAHDLNMFYFLVDRKAFKKFFTDGLALNLPFENLPEEFDLLMETNKADIKRYVSSKMKTIRWTILENRLTAIIYLDRNQPYVTEGVMEKYPNTDVVCMIDLANLRGSFRARKENVIVNDIAKLFGGGGHKQAAGFTVSDEAFERLVIKPNTEKDEYSEFLSSIAAQNPNN